MRRDNAFRVTEVGGPAIVPDQKTAGALFRQMASEPGAQCANCAAIFSVVRRPAAAICVQNSGAGRVVVSSYLLCSPCRQRLKQGGEAEVARVLEDARLAAQTLLTPAEGSVQ